MPSMPAVDRGGQWPYSRYAKQDLWTRPGLRTIILRAGQHTRVCDEGSCSRQLASPCFPTFCVITTEEQGRSKFPPKRVLNPWGESLALF